MLSKFSPTTMWDNATHGEMLRNHQLSEWYKMNGSHTEHNERGSTSLRQNTNALDPSCCAAARCFYLLCKPCNQGDQTARVPALTLTSVDGRQPQPSYAICQMVPNSLLSQYIILSIIWSDEVIFKLNGHLNQHNCIYRATDNPRITLQEELNVPGVTVWVGVTIRSLLGP